MKTMGDFSHEIIHVTVRHLSVMQRHIYSTPNFYIKCYFILCISLQKFMIKFTRSTDKISHKLFYVGPPPSSIQFTLEMEMMLNCSKVAIS